METIIQRLLAKDPNLTSLDLRYLFTAEADEITFKRLMVAISSHTGLRHLSLQRLYLAKLTPQQFDDLMQCLANHPSLKSLDLEEVRVCGDRAVENSHHLHLNQFKQLLNMLATCKLEKINLDHTNIDHLELEHFAALMHIIANHPTLKSVKFDSLYRSHPKEIWECFIHQIKNSKNLTSIDISYFDLKTPPLELLKPLLDYLFIHSNLTSIRMHGMYLTEFSEEAFQYFVDALAKNNKLIELDLGSCGLKDLSSDRRKMLLEALSNHKTLTELNLWGTGFYKLEKEDFDLFMHFIARNKLQSLKLEGAKLYKLLKDEKKAKMFLEALSSNQTLQHLNLCGYLGDEDKYEDEHFKMLLDCLANHRTFNSLHIDYVSTLPESQRKMFLDFVAKSKLTSLTLRSFTFSQLDEKTLQSLCEIIANHPTLIHLDISNHYDCFAKKKDKKKFELLCEMLERNRKLKCDFTNCHFTKKQVSVLRKLRPDLEYTFDGYHYIKKENKKRAKESAYAKASADREEKETIEAFQAKCSWYPILYSKEPVGELEIRDREIKEKEAQLLALAIKQNKTMKGINLYDNKLTSECSEDIIRAVGQNRSITSITFGQNSFTIEFSKLLAEALSTNKSIQKFDISGMRLTGHMKILFENIKNKNLKEISLHNTGLNSADAQAIAAFIQKPENQITSLKLSHNKFGGLGAQHLAAALKVNQTITHLDIGRCHIEATGIKAIGNALLENKTLKELLLSHNTIGNEGLSHLLDCLMQNTSVTRLNLNDIPLSQDNLAKLLKVLERGHITQLELEGPEHSPDATVFINGEKLKMLADCLAKSECHLQSLNLSNNNLGDEGAVLLANALSFNSKLKTLILKKNGISDRGVQALGVALQQNSNLEALDLEKSEMKDDGAIALALAMSKNKQLKRVELLGWNRDGSHLTVKGLTALAEAVVKNTSLEHFCITNSGSVIDEKLAKLFAKALLQNKRLKSLGLRSHMFTLEALLTIFEAISKSKTLESFDLQGSANLKGVGIDKEAIMLLVETLKLNRSLTHLNLNHTGNGVTEIDHDILIKGIEANTSLTQPYRTPDPYADPRRVQYYPYAHELERIIMRNKAFTARADTLFEDILNFQFGTKPVKATPEVEEEETKEIKETKDGKEKQALSEGSSFSEIFEILGILGQAAKYALLEAFGIDLSRRYAKSYAEAIKERWVPIEYPQTDEVKEKKEMKEKPQHELIKEKYQSFIDACDRLAKDGYGNERYLDLLRQYAALSYCSHENSPLSKMERLNWVERLFKKPDEENFKRRALPILADLHWSIAQELISRERSSDDSSQAVLTEAIRHHLMSAYVCSRLSPKNAFMDEMANTCLEFIVTELGAHKDKAKFIKWDSSLEDKLAALQDNDSKAYEEFQLSCQEHCRSRFLNPKHFAIKERVSSLSLDSLDLEAEKPAEEEIPLCLAVFEEEKEEKEMHEHALAPSSTSEPSPLQMLYQYKISLRLPLSSEREKAKCIRRPDAPGQG